LMVSVRSRIPARAAKEQCGTCIRVRVRVRVRAAKEQCGTYS
jgi:hypothetical protein